MRQRLLLVAGWLLAVVGSGLVASGAVAIAGGQVLDRALQPLTAAEVAALPVVTVDSPDNVEPHASGGLVPNAGEPTDSSDVEEPSTSEPSGTGGSSASTDPSTESGGTSTGPLDPFDQPATQAQIETNEGGGASFVDADGTLILLWATPQPGFVVQLTSSTPTEVTVSFTSNRVVWVVRARLVEGNLFVASSVAPLT